MALLLLEGFDKYGRVSGVAANNVFIQQLSGDWTSFSNPGGMYIVAGLSGTGNAYYQNAGCILSKTLAASYSRLIGGCRFQSDFGTTFPGGVQFSSGGSAQCCITINPSGTITLRNGATSSSTIVATSAPLVAQNSIHYLEWDITFGNTAAYQVWLDGVSIMSGTGDTTTVAANDANTFAITAAGGSTGFWVDDLYLFDSTGTTNNAVLLTSPRIDTTFPVSDSSVQFGFAAATLGTAVPPSVGGASTLSVNTLYLRRFVPAVNCTLGSIGFLPNATNATVNYRGVVYADSSGAAGALLSSGSTVTGITVGINQKLPLTTPQSLTAGTPYWLGLMVDTGGIILWTLDSGLAGYRATATFSSGAPGTAPAMTSGQPTFMVWGNLTAASNWYTVSQQPPPGLPGYVFDTTVGHEDLYGFSAVGGTPTAIHAVAVKAYVSKSDSGTRTASVRLKSGATDSAGSSGSQTPGTSFGWMGSFYPTDPNTSAAWTASGLNAATAGLKVES